MFNMLYKIGGPIDSLREKRHLFLDNFSLVFKGCSEEVWI